MANESVDHALPSPAVSGSVSWDRSLDDRQTVAAVEFLEEVAGTEAIRAASALALARLRLSPGANVLDLGCGAGAFFPALGSVLAENGSITGVDHADALLREAHRRHASTLRPALALARGDAHALPFANDTFDAAHTERVLMHVEDPAAAMAELRRVVRSGGWIVCVEPDLGGIRLDLPVQRWARGLIDGFLASIRNPAIGLTLNRIMTGAGLVDRTIDPITEVEQNYDPDVAEIFGEAANEAVSQGWLSQDEARDALAALAETDIRGHYTSYATMLVVAGRVP